MPPRKTALIYLALACYTLAPIASVLIAGLIAKFTGATVDESGPHPCLLLGFDIGGLLSSMLVAGWLALFTLPTGILAILIFSLLRRPAPPDRAAR